MHGEEGGNVVSVRDLYLSCSRTLGNLRRYVFDWRNDVYELECFRVCVFCRCLSWIVIFLHFWESKKCIQMFFSSPIWLHWGIKQKIPISTRFGEEKWIRLSLSRISIIKFSISQMEIRPYKKKNIYSNNLPVLRNYLCTVFLPSFLPPYLPSFPFFFFQLSFVFILFRTLFFMKFTAILIQLSLLFYPNRNTIFLFRLLLFWRWTMKTK